MKRNNWRKLLGLIYPRLWFQIWLGFAVLISLLLFFLGTLLIQTSREGVRTTLFRDHCEIAERAAQEINLFVRSPVKLLESTAALVGISHTDIWKQETLLVELGLRFPIFTRISSVSPEGVELTSSQPGTPLQNLAADPQVIYALKGKTAVSQVALSDEAIPFMKVAVPYFNRGKVAGALAATVSMRGMWDIVDNIQIGETGFAFAVTRDGTVIAHPDKKLVLKQTRLTASIANREVLKEETGSLILEDSKLGEMLTAYAPVNGSEWVLVTQQPLEEAFLFAKKMTRDSRLFILSGLGFSLFICVGLAFLFTRPVKKLAFAADEVAKGNFNVNLDSARKDEIGMLFLHFNHMVKQLKKAKEMERITAMGMAAANIAHELRNPLVAIKTYTQLFNQRKSEPEFIDRFEKTVPPEINRLDSMLNELSDYARVNKMNFSRLTLNTLLEETLVLMKEKMEANQIRVDCDGVLKEPVTVMGDKEKLKQVFINFMSNAVGAMDGGGNLSVKMKRENHFICVAFSDTGIGIPEEELSKIFEPFHSKRDKGMGLGLAICHNIVELHQGRIEVKSQPQKGTTFYLYLPVV